jgi:hypothetical protein
MGLTPAAGAGQICAMSAIDEDAGAGRAAQAMVLIYVVLIAAIVIGTQA